MPHSAFNFIYGWGTKVKPSFLLFSLQALKGILKNNTQPLGAGRGTAANSATSYLARLRARGKVITPGTGSASSASRPSSNSSVRDSIEVAREQLSARQHSAEVSLFAACDLKVGSFSIHWVRVAVSEGEISISEVQEEIR